MWLSNGVPLGSVPSTPPPHTHTDTHWIETPFCITFSIGGIQVLKYFLGRSISEVSCQLYADF